MLAWRRVQDGNGVGPLDEIFSFFSFPPALSLLLLALLTRKNQRTDEQLEATC